MILHQPHMLCILRLQYSSSLIEKSFIIIECCCWRLNLGHTIGNAYDYTTMIAYTFDKLNIGTIDKIGLLGLQNPCSFGK